MRGIKIITILFLILLFSGCATINLDRAIRDRQNFQGKTPQQIRDTLGYPYYKNFSYIGSDFIENWTYEHTSLIFPYPRTTITITFTNGIVTSVSYY